MPRNHNESRPEPRPHAAREAAQPRSGQPLPEDENDDLENVENAETAPSPLTAREFEMRPPSADDVQDDAEEAGAERDSDDEAPPARKRPGTK